MDMKRKLFVLSIVFLCVTGIIFGAVFGGSNFSFSQYPSFSGFKPSAPFAYKNTISRWEYDSYKRDVEMYIQKVEQYIENADNDIDRIIQAQEEAIRTANMVVQEYNQFVKTIKVESR